MSSNLSKTVGHPPKSAIERSKHKLPFAPVSPQLQVPRSVKSAIAILLCLSWGITRADTFFKLVGYQCDRSADRLTLTYDAAANGEGQAMTEAKTKHQWDPWSLIEMRDDDNIGRLGTIKRTCKLSDGTYQVELGPQPGNMNIQHKCGAWISAWAEVRKGSKVIYPRTDFESGVGCFFADGEITTRVEITPRRKGYKLTKIRAEKLLSDISPMRE